MRFIFRKKESVILNQKKLFHIILLIIILISFFSITFSLKSVNEGDENYKSYEINNKSLERLKVSSYMDSPLLWYSQTGYEVQAVAISSDGNYSISGSKNSGGKDLIALYHKNSSVPLWVKDDLNGEVFSVDISFNGSYMVAGTGYGPSKDTRIYLFEKNSSLPVWSYECENIVFSVAISSDGNYIVAGSKDNKVYLFHKSSPSPIWSYHAGNRISSVAISSNGYYLVAGSGDHKIYFFERTSSTPFWSYTIDYVPGNMGDIDSVSISSDGSYIAAGTQVYEGTSKVLLFHRSSSIPLWKFSAGDYINSVSIDSEGNYIVAGGQDKKIILFNRSSSTPLWSYITEDSVNSVSISANGEYIVSGGSWYDKSVYFFNRSNNIPLWKYETVDILNSVSISAKGNFLVAGGWDKNVYLFKSNGTQKHITLYTDAENPDTNSDFNLYWNTFFTPEYIWIYEHNSYITDVNETVNLVDSGYITDVNVTANLFDSENGLNNPYRITGLLSGEHYFKVKINSSIYGEIYSSCVKVNIFALYSLLWSQFYGGDNTEGGKGVSLDSFGNVYQTGYIMNGPHGYNDGIIIKSSNSGFQIWNKTFGGSSNDGGWDVCVDSADNVYVIGYKEGIFIAKYDLYGNQIWNTIWNEMSGATGRSIDVDSEDNIYVAGYAGDSATTDLVFIKYNSNGSKIWQRIWGGDSFEGRYGLKLAVDSKDNLFVTAQTNSFGAGDSDAVLIKYDKFGNQLWNKTWGGVDIDGAEAISIDSNNNIFISGYTDSFSANGFRNLFIAKFNNSGTQIWNKTWFGIGSADCRDIIVDSNDNILATGTTYDSMTELVYLLIYYGNGEFLWSTTWGDEDSMENEGWGVAVDSFDNIYISGFIEYYEGHNEDIFLLKYSQFYSPGPFFLTSDADKPDTDGIFNLNWISSSGANNYSIYVYDKYFTEINTSLTLLADQTAISPYEIKTTDGIYYYCVVAFNNYGNSTSNCIEIVVQLDSGAPILIINLPTLNEKFGFDPPNYNITILEENLDIIWYRLYNETIITQKIIITSIYGVIDADLWDQFGNGTVIIKFFANDTLGNLGFTEVLIRKDVETHSSSPAILGYNLYVLFCIISFISVISIKLRNNKLSK